MLPRRLLLRHCLLRPQFHTTALVARKVIHRFDLADIGEGITECEIVKWNVDPLTSVQTFDSLCEVQSDKASVEITSPFEGVVRELLVPEGDVAKVGSGLCLIEVEEDDTGVNESPSMSAEEYDGHAPALTGAAPSSTDAVPSVRTNLHPLDPSRHAAVLAAPSVRYFARQNRVDLAGLFPGSGPGGRVERRDVDLFLARQKEDDVAGVAEDAVIELGRTRQAMWKAMGKSLEIPHFGYSTTLDITALHEMMPTLNAYIPKKYLPSSNEQAAFDLSSAVNPFPLATTDVPDIARYTKLTYLPVLLKTLAKAMQQWPLFRSTITSNSSGRSALSVRSHADIGLALSTPSGLYTPTLQRADTQSVYELAAGVRRLAALGRAMPCGLGVAEMPRRGGTLTVSNVGAVGQGMFAAPLLVPGGGVAIVAIGRARWVWDVERGDGTGERRLQVGVSWSADHRVVEGAEMAAFCECWRGYVEEPMRLIGEGV